MEKPKSISPCGVNMKSPVRSLTLLSIGLLLVSGCVSEPVPEGDPLPMLLDFTTCEAYYPDETPVDCAEDDHHMAAPEWPEAWVCWEGWTYGRGDHASLWTDGQGQWGIYYDIRGIAKEIPFIQAEVEVGFPNTRAEGLFTGPTTGFARLTDTVDDRVESWKITFRSFWVKGVPEDLFVKENLDVYGTHYEGVPWYIAVVGHEEGDLYFPIRTELSGDDPGPRTTVHTGEDFNMTVGFGKYRLGSGTNTWLRPDPYGCTLMIEDLLE